MDRFLAVAFAACIATGIMIAAFGFYLLSPTLNPDPFRVIKPLPQTMLAGATDPDPITRQIGLDMLRDRMTEFPVGAHIPGHPLGLPVRAA